MGIERTVFFADLVGSTGLFQSLGNAKAAQAVRLLTQSIADTATAHGGRLIKMLGDGVLMLFDDGVGAGRAATEVQRAHVPRVSRWPETWRTFVKIGLARGPIVEVQGDCYGDAVNIAARLCDMAGGSAIWATAEVVEALPPTSGIRYRGLGAIRIRGLAEQRPVFQIEWDDALSSDLMTVQGAISTRPPESGEPYLVLRWLDRAQMFRREKLPIHLGRAPEAEFILNDPRVSRMHARISHTGAAIVLADLSSYGTWVRFAEPAGELALRRSECLLHGVGELALGAPFSDFTASTVHFEVLVD